MDNLISDVKSWTQSLYSITNVLILLDFPRMRAWKSVGRDAVNPVSTRHGRIMGWLIPRVMQGVNASIIYTQLRGNRERREGRGERQRDRETTFSDAIMCVSGIFPLLPRHPLFTFHSDRRPSKMNRGPWSRMPTASAGSSWSRTYRLRTLVTLVCSRLYHVRAWLFIFFLPATRD